MARALLVIDIQLDYFPGGAYPLVAPEAAATAAGRVLEAARSEGWLVVHVQHHSVDGTPFLVPGTEGAQIHPAVAPADDELVVTKHAPNSFLETGLQETLSGAGVDDLVVAGMMTSMCVDSTVRSAAERGFTVTVVADACAAPDLTLGASTVPGPQVHAAFLAALGGGFATVTDSEALLAAR
ncbi:cysteine hydrolase family protein [Kineococcus rhizosphaerae]|uniref:Nicotinamidase-related amidase n=1 Tax=Kineococcus rhizosphaerae TaxID=559628 RepID=A0A2T0R3N8_9ACTN|nr:cysteine hydrolase family protein [Kineococcus rhizosphaerae]PRY14631.1 nicotinamidase-related amidase [Kineococcus rhizosphaerae]